MCEFCSRKLLKDHECGKDYPIHPCANGDLGVRAQYLDGGIVLYKDRHIASGYFDVNYCPICGRRISLEGATEESDLVPLNQVLCDMHNPDGGYAAMAARDYYYKYYATEKERKAMDRRDNLLATFGIIFTIAFWAAVIFAAISAFN